MTDDGTRYENIREAIGVMTAWTAEGGADFAANYYNSLIDNYGVEKVPDIVAGLISLNGLLLTMRAKEQGVSDVDTLRGLAERFAGR
jgi:hypothetical protein